MSKKCQNTKNVGCKKKIRCKKKEEMKIIAKSNYII